jgi:RNA polymerase sigma-70 factor (ECF subfamily)
MDVQDGVVRDFAAACMLGSVAAVRSLLGPDVTVVSDGGGQVRAALVPLHGAEECARLVTDLLGHRQGTTLTVEAVNGGSGIVQRSAGQVTAVVTLGVVATKVVDVWIVLSPDKLRHWQHD